MPWYYVAMEFQEVLVLLLLIIVMSLGWTFFCVLAFPGYAAPASIVGAMYFVWVVIRDLKEER